MIKFTIPGRPVPAVRMTQKGKFRKDNDAAHKYLAYKDAVGWEAKKAGVKQMEGKIVIDIKIYLCGGHHGDWDNYAKSICDGLNGIAYEDDRQIIDGRVRKIIGVTKVEERAEVEIWGCNLGIQSRDRKVLVP